MKKVINRIIVIFILIILLFEFLLSNSLISYASDVPGLDEDTVNNIVSIGAGIVSIIIWIPKFILTGVTWMIDLGVSAMAASENATSPGVITPYKIFFNKYDLLNINIFDLEVGGSDGFVHTFRENIAKWYYAMRVLACAILLVILIYVGIRMALASVAEDKAKYNKMLFDWVMRISFNIRCSLYGNIYYLL